MTREPLDLHHRPLLHDKLRRIQVRFSEYSFANLYLFREIHRYQVLQNEDCTLVQGITRDGASFIVPLCERQTPDVDYLRDIMREHGLIFPVCENWLPFFPEEEFEISGNPDDEDYIYTVDKMARYPGRDLHSKRNLLKQFLEQHSYSIEPINEHTLHDATSILDGWLNESSFSTAHDTDYHSALEALQLHRELELEGFVCMIDGKPAGYVLGEALTDDTFALHFAKGLRGYKGLYQFLFNRLALDIEGRFEYINFEQDLGLSSLRQAKSSYNPDMKARKYRIKLRQQS